MRNYDVDNTRFEYARALWKFFTVEERKLFCLAADLSESKAHLENMPNFKALIDVLCDLLSYTKQMARDLKLWGQ